MELVNFIKYYKSLSNPRPGAYAVIRKFINKSKKLKGNEKKLLRDLIRILESPEKAGDEELSDLKKAAERVLKK